MNNRQRLLASTVIAAGLAAFAATAAAETGYVLGENLFLSPGVASLARTEGQVNLGHDPRIQCQPRTQAAASTMVCYTRQEIDAWRQTLVRQGHYLAGSDVVVSPGVSAIIVRDGPINPYNDPRMICDVVNLPSESQKVNYCQTRHEARLQHEAAMQYLLTARRVFQRP